LDGAAKGQPMKKAQRKIILASSSKYRQALLARLRLPFDCISVDIDETRLLNESPEQLVKRLAISKAGVISKKYTEALVIGSDQVAVFGNQVIGKPGNHLNATQQLKQFSGNKIQFLTGVALSCDSMAIENYAMSEVIVKFKPLTDKQIENYLLLDKPYDCAGSFKVESLGIALFESVKSDDPTSLEGLPLILVSNLLRDAGIEVIANE
jgi:septum formation protein